MKKFVLFVGLTVASAVGCKSVQPRPVVVFRVELPESKYLGGAQPIVEGRIEFDTPTCNKQR